MMGDDMVSIAPKETKEGSTLSDNLFHSSFSTVGGLESLVKPTEPQAQCGPPKKDNIDAPQAICHT